MIERLQEVMLYVDDQENAKQFWTEKLNFKVISDDVANDMRVIILSPTTDAQTSIVLHDKAKVEAMGMGVNTGTPSLMFVTQDIDQLYDELKAKGVTVGDKVDMPGGTIFNFSDDEGHYFAVKS
ncbi:VOC family protein [Staphylococcus chromogenes]|uniref:VOC family protein n=1 Tax=Staphylococcus chromogenes TaxID=46126 RepID=UPI000D1AED0F|nr:VOC family protein [Staphylococcus chromogenes]PTG19718.1 glyoxalase/bleomycin resistance/extradiol dioxygenase family protein [Staphylococcus chromogenes]